MAKPNRYRHLAIHAVLVQRPGLLKSEIARALGISTGAVDSALPAMEKSGLLLFEDDERRLYPFVG